MYYRYEFIDQVNKIVFDLTDRFYSKGLILKRLKINPLDYNQLVHDLVYNQEVLHMMCGRVVVDYSRPILNGKLFIYTAYGNVELVKDYRANLLINRAKAQSTDKTI